MAAVIRPAIVQGHHTIKFPFVEHRGNLSRTDLTTWLHDANMISCHIGISYTGKTIILVKKCTQLPRTILPLQRDRNGWAAQLPQHTRLYVKTIPKQQVWTKGIGHTPCQT